MNLDILVNQLPYEDKRRVRDEIAALTTHIRSLSPAIGNLISNDGVEHNKVLVLSGTVPIYYLGATYNIPLEIYLLERFPKDTPLIFVRPTSNMIVKPGHHHVDPEGTVHMPYLTEWNYQSSNLVDLVTILSSLFSSDPPLFSKPVASAISSTTSELSRGTYYKASNQPSSSSEATTSIARHPSQSTPPLAQSRASVGSLWNSRSQLEREVTEKLKRELFDYLSRIREELDEELNVQNELVASNDAAVSNLDSMEAMKTKLESGLDDVHRASSALDEWCQREAGKEKASADSFIVAFDDLSSQAVRLQAEQHAIDDVIYYMERALSVARGSSSANLDALGEAGSSGMIDLPSFLKITRNLARQQFLASIHLKKINATMRQNEASLRLK